MVLFGADRERHFPVAWIQAGRFAGSDKTRILDRAEIHSLPVRAVEEAIAFVQKHSLHGAEIGHAPTAGSGGMLVHTADYLRERGQHATSAGYFAQEMNWGNAAIGKINSVLHGLDADITSGASTITDPQFLEDGRVKKFSLVLANFSFSDEFWWLKPEQQTDDKKKKDKLKKEIFGKEGFKDPFGRFGRSSSRGPILFLPAVTTRAASAASSK